MIDISNNTVKKPFSKVNTILGDSSMVPAKKEYILASITAYLRQEASVSADSKKLDIKSFDIQPLMIKSSVGVTESMVEKDITVSLMSAEDEKAISYPLKDFFATKLPVEDTGSESSSSSNPIPDGDGGWWAFILYAVIGVLVVISITMVVLGVMAYSVNKKKAEADNDDPEYFNADRETFVQSETDY